MSWIIEQLEYYDENLISSKITSTANSNETFIALTYLVNTLNSNILIITIISHKTTRKIKFKLLGFIEK